MLGWRILPPLQTGQHDGVGTVLQPRQFYGQPAAGKRKRGTSDELRRTNCGRSFAAQSGETVGALALARFLTQDLIWKARLQLPASRLCGLNDKHTPALEQHGRHGFRAESRLVTLQRQTAHPRNHSTGSPDNETVLKTNTQANTECSNAHAHSFQANVFVCLWGGGLIDGVIYGQRKKNGNAEKTAVCLLQVNMQQLWRDCQQRPAGQSRVWVYVWLCGEPYGCM